jgi:deoxyribose-phosphate aldolase
MESIVDIKSLTQGKFAKILDHAILVPETTSKDIMEMCQKAAKYNISCVFVQPCFLPIAVEILDGTGVNAGSVVGFPQGVNRSIVKAYEAEDIIKMGGQEIDMVLNIGKLLEGDRDYVLKDIRKVRHAMGPDLTLKVILETHYLSREQIILACQIAEEAGANYVKTSTGFAATGYTVENLKLMRSTVSPHVGVKAAHGVRSLKIAINAIHAGANRLGATKTFEILDDFKSLDKSQIELLLD